MQYTHSGKKVEVAVKKILNGEDVTVRSAYVNPNSLDLYYNIPELQQYWTYTHYAYSAGNLTHGNIKVYLYCLKSEPWLLGRVLKNY